MSRRWFARNVRVPNRAGWEPPADEPPPPPPPPPGTWVERATTPPTPVRWWDPKDGSDSNDGTTPAKAWKTLNHAITNTLLAPGANVIGVVAKTYTTTDTGTSTDTLSGGTCMVSVKNIKAPANNRLWIVAPESQEREAIFLTGGHGGLYFEYCENISLWGLTVKGATNHDAPNTVVSLFSTQRSVSMHAYRCLATDCNLARDQSCFGNQYGQYAYYEECEAYSFFRHAFSFVFADHCHVRRCYANARGAVATANNPSYSAGAYHREGVNGYRARFHLVENCIFEGLTQVSVQCQYIDSLGGVWANRGYNQLWLGGLTYGAHRLLPNMWRRSGTHWQNLFKHWVMVAPHANNSDTGALDQQYGTDFARYQNCTVVNSTQGGGIRGDTGNHDGSGATEYQQITGEAPVTWRVRHKNHVIWGNKWAYREARNTGLQRYLSHCLLYGNGGTDPWTNISEATSKKFTDADLVTHVFTDSLNVDPEWGTYGVGADKSVVFVPHNHPTLAGAGDGVGIDGHMGATVLFRYEGNVNEGAFPTENLTSTPLWNPTDGRFPVGAVIAGYNDQDSAGDHAINRSAHTFYQRMGMDSATVRAAAYPT